MSVLLIFLIILMILGAIVALQVRDLISSVICIGIVGFGLVLAFLILQAPDLAMVQIVVETFSLIILVAAILKTTRKDTSMEGNTFVLLGAGVALVIILLLFSYPVLKSLPQFGEPRLRMAKSYSELSRKKIGAANIVESVILDFRGYDTLGEVTVLFAAAVGVLVVLRRYGLKKRGKKGEGEE